MFNSELFLATQTPEDQPFFAELLETQSFQVYIEELKKKYLEMKGDIPAE